MHMHMPGADPAFVVEGWLKKGLMRQGKQTAKVLLSNTQN